MIKLILSSITHAEVGAQESVDLAIDHALVDDLELIQLQGSLQLTRVADGISIYGELDTQVRTECTRCLTPFLQPVTIELEDIINLPGAESTQERPVTVDQDGWADLTPLVREYTWLGLPGSPICSPDCKGICPRCGGNRNLGECTCGEPVSIDPRWEVLRDLISESDQA